MTVSIPADPTRMRTAAASLRSDAQLVASLAAQVQGQADALQFTGPAADDFRASMQEQTTQAQQIAGELGDLANKMLITAAQVEEEQQQALLDAQQGTTP
jgi:uncharacterized protein YukE